MSAHGKYMAVPGVRASDRGTARSRSPSPVAKSPAAKSISGASEDYAIKDGKISGMVGEVPSMRDSQRPFQTVPSENRYASGYAARIEPRFSTDPGEVMQTMTSIRKSLKATARKATSTWASIGRATVKMQTLKISTMDSVHRESTASMWQASTVDSRTLSRNSDASLSDTDDVDDGLTMQSAIFLLVTAIVGCGVVALPSLMKLGGWIIVPIIGFLISCAFVEVGQVISKSIDMAETQLETETIKSFEDFGRVAFGNCGAYTVRTITTTGFFGTLVVYTILITQNVYTFLNGSLSKIYVLAMISPLLVALSMLRDLQAMAKIMPVGVVASLSSCVLICVKSGLDAQLWQDESDDVIQDLHNKWPEELTSLGTILAVFFSAYSVMGTVPSIRGQMKDPHMFLDAFRRALAVVFVVYMCVMGLGYYGYGNYVEDNVVTSMMQPFFAHHKSSDKSENTSDEKDNPLTSALLSFFNLGTFMAALVSTYLLIGFALFFACIMGMVQKVSDTSPVCQPMTWPNCCLRVSIVIVVTGIGLFMPHFREVMAIMSSICCSCNNVFFPLAFNYKIESVLSEKFAEGAFAPAEQKNFRTSACRRIAHFFILCLALFCAVLGLKDSLSRLTRELKSDTHK